jgi:hypothetical protein
MHTRAYSLSSSCPSPYPSTAAARSPFSQSSKRVGAVRTATNPHIRSKCTASKVSCSEVLARSICCTCLVLWPSSRLSRALRLAGARRERKREKEGERAASAARRSEATISFRFSQPGGFILGLGSEPLAFLLTSPPLTPPPPPARSPLPR